MSYSSFQTAVRMVAATSRLRAGLRKRNIPPVGAPEEDKQLREMVEAGKGVTMMALRLKRSELAVRGRRLSFLKVSLKQGGSRINPQREHQT